MLKFLENLFTRREPRDSGGALSEPSPLNGEALNLHFASPNGDRCPDCQHRGLIEGPSGGLSVNCICPNCSSEFNISPFGGDRISEPGKGRTHLYARYFVLPV